MELLFDNSATFRSASIKSLCLKWNVSVTFRCAYRPSGNGIIERAHRTIKSMAAKSGGDVRDMVFWYNVSPKSGVDGNTLPSARLHNYRWNYPVIKAGSAPVTYTGALRFSCGQNVYVKPPNARCTTQWTIGTVTKDCRGGVAVEVNHIPRHIADIRVVPGADVVINDEDSDGSVVPGDVMDPQVGIEEDQFMLGEVVEEDQLMLGDAAEDGQFMLDEAVEDGQFMPVDGDGDTEEAIWSGEDEQYMRQRQRRVARRPPHLNDYYLDHLFNDSV